MDTIRIFKTINSYRRDLTGGGDGFIFVNKDGEIASSSAADSTALIFVRILGEEAAN